MKEEFDYWNEYDKQQEKEIKEDCFEIKEGDCERWLK